MSNNAQLTSGQTTSSSGICDGTPDSVLVFEEEMSSLAGLLSRK